MFLLNWLKERQFCRFVCPCIWVKFDIFTSIWMSPEISCAASPPEPFLIDKGVEQTVRSGKWVWKKEKGWKQGWVTDAEIGVMGRVMEDGNRKSLPQNRPTSQKTGWRKKNAGNGKKPASDRDLETNDWKQGGAPSLPAPSLLSIHQLPSSKGNAYAIISSITRTNQ